MAELTNEDWERVHFTDEMYKKELEYNEMEYYYEQERKNRKPPAKITVRLPKDIKTKEPSSIKDKGPK